ncbi:FdhF/YdeP family oxidoreductase [bacterium]|nr:FdhF/YdeP family oxidoreductase [bacterium]
MSKIRKRWTPRNWSSLMPFGLGHQHPNNFKELFRALGENRDNLAYAWRILNEGVCDGCALGTSGMHDWTLDGIHLCNIRLRLLRLNTMGALDAKVLGDVSALRGKRNDVLRNLGRIPAPMRRRRGEPGFTRISWQEALESIAARIRSAGPERIAFFMTSRGMPNESYYAAQKAVRSFGSNNIDNAARICHSPSTSALKDALGVAATTCSYADWIASDLIVFIGSNVANNQPVATKYLHFAKKANAKVVSVNTCREPGMENYWIPSLPESALFGTRLTDRFFLVNTGGDLAFLTGVMKALVEGGLCDDRFIDVYTTGFAELREALARETWATLEQQSGSTQAEMEELARMIGGANKAVFVWSMGITQHERGADQVRAILNLVLSRGFVGREGCGAMPIRGHSGVQGGAEMGCYATAFPGGKSVTAANAEVLSQQWGFTVPTEPGLTAPEMIDAAHDGELDLLFSAGGNFLETLPDPARVEAALARVPLRVHMDIVLTNQMLVDPAEEVLLLPAATRYEIPGGVTQTSTERRIIFSPEVPGPRIDEARPEWEFFAQLAALVNPSRAEAFMWRGTAEVREEIARVVPMYRGIEKLKAKGDQFQYGGRHLCEGWNFPTHDGKAHFQLVLPESREIPEGAFLLSTRRGKQFNSLIHEQVDALNGAGRGAILISEADAARLGLRAGQEIELANERGRFRGHVFPTAIRPGNLQVHWPEANHLIDPHRRERDAGVPDYNAIVRIETMP